MMRPALGSVILGSMVCTAWCAPAAADGGSLRLSASRGGYQISVFTAPAPFRAGPVDISVLVQDSVTHAPIPDAPVTVRMTKPGQRRLEFPATTEAATNKLFRAAQFTVPEPGRWDLEIQVDGEHGPTAIQCDLDAALPLPRWQEVWPWVGWPAVVIGLFVFHQWRVGSAQPAREQRVDRRT